MALLGVYDVIGVWQTQTNLDIDGIAVANFTLDENLIHAFAGADNVSVLQFKSDVGELTDGYFDFDKNNITKAEVELSFIEMDKQDSDGANVAIIGNEMFVRFGAFTMPHKSTVTIKIFDDENTNGVVICGPGLAASNLVVNIQ